MKRLFELREAGKLRTIILPYLGQDNSRLNHRLDPAAQAAFTPLAQAALKAAGGRTFNTAGGKVVAIEGAAPPKNAVINEWDSLDQATAYYKSKAWNDIAPQREKAIKTVRRYAVEAVK